MQLLSGEITEPHKWEVNIGSGNGLVQSGNKPLPEPILAPGQQVLLSNT